MPKSSLQIQNEVTELRDENARLAADFNAAAGDEQAAIHDQIVANDAKMRVLQDMLTDALTEEERVRAQGGVPLAAAPEPEAFKPGNVAEAFLGDPKDFKGLSASADLGRMVRIADEYTEFNLPTLETIERSLPRQTDDAMPYFGFINTLPKGTTDSKIVTFYERDLSKYVNGAKTWHPGETKGKSAMAWQKRSAYSEVIAHFIPVLETEIRDYGNLQSIINTELLYGLRYVESGKVLMQEADADDPGIVGITKTENVLKYAAKSGEGVVDSVRRMATDVFLASGYRPTHVALHPYVAEAIQLSKDANGRYIEYMVNGKLYGLTVTEDLNLSETTGSGASAKTTYGAMVYWNGGATYFTLHNNALAVGLVNDQFTKNELTIRAEGEHLLKVTTPTAFCYMADTGVTR